MKPPLLSIVLPNYNHAHYLPTAIESVLSQDFTDFELLVIDDGSTDNSVSVINQYCQKDRRVHLVAHNSNRGVCLACNEGLVHARGKYIHFLSADDFYMPTFLSTSIKHLLQWPEVGMSVSDMFHFFDDKSDDLTPFRFIPEAKKSYPFSKSTIHEVCKKTRLRFGGHACIVKTEFVKKYRGFNPDFLSYSDWFLYTQIAFLEGAIYIPEPLIAARCVRLSFSKTILQEKSARKSMFENMLIALEEEPLFLKKLKVSGDLSSILGREPLTMLKRWEYWLPSIQMIRKVVRRRWKQFSHRPFVSEFFLQERSLYVEKSIASL